MDEITIKTYKEQLQQIELALSSLSEDDDKKELKALRDNILELLSLTNTDDPESGETSAPSNTNNTESENSLDDEYALFMAEIEKEEATTTNPTSDVNQLDCPSDRKLLEGTKCRAPHTHSWGDVVYHNAMISSVSDDTLPNSNNFEVRVLFINPTHQEMLPCPYFLETECKFTEDRCKFSHGEVVLFSTLQEFVEPKFDQIAEGGTVLAKQENNIWSRALVKNVKSDRCIVRFELDRKMLELAIENILPLEGEDENEGLSEGSCEDNREEVINMSLVNKPGDQALGDWEKHTKGIGSKLMQKMGYIVGTGLGRNSDGRVDPVTAVILPAGKSLDHCMKLREIAGGDKNFFNAEKMLKRIQRRQEKREKKKMERLKTKDLNSANVFGFLNKSLSLSKNMKKSKTQHRQEIKNESTVKLNISALKTDEDIKRLEVEILRIRQRLDRGVQNDLEFRKNLEQQLVRKAQLMKQLQAEANNIKNEQNLRIDKKKMTIF